MVPPRSFSVASYLLLVFALSWPFQFAYALLGDEYRPLLLVSMLMTGVATYVAGRWLFRDGFAAAGWRIGRPAIWLAAVLLPLLLWLLPLIVEIQLEWRTTPNTLDHGRLAVDFATAFAITLLPAFGEEFSWRGYLLPRLMRRYPPRKALLLHGLVTWLWHLPVIVVMALQFDAAPFVAIVLVLLISLIPTVMHALVFAWLWARSGSLAVATVYHAGFDEVRDTLQAHVGFGLLAEYWQMLALTLLGACVWWRADRIKRDMETSHAA